MKVGDLVRHKKHRWIGIIVTQASDQQECLYYNVYWYTPRRSERRYLMRTTRRFNMEVL